MSDKKPRKPRVVTEATKAKLPRPKQVKRKAQGVATQQVTPDSANERKNSAAYVRTAPNAPEPAVEITYSSPAIPCGEDVMTARLTAVRVEANEPIEFTYYIQPESLTIPPVTEPFPWPVRVLNWLDDAPSAIRRWLARTLNATATWLRRLAFKVAP